MSWLGWLRLDVPFGVGVESVEAALVFSVDEEFVYAFYVVFALPEQQLVPNSVLQKFLYWGLVKNVLNFAKRCFTLRGIPAINPNMNSCMNPFKKISLDTKQ